MAEWALVTKSYMLTYSRVWKTLFLSQKQKLMSQAEHHGTKLTKWYVFIRTTKTVSFMQQLLIVNSFKEYAKRHYIRESQLSCIFVNGAWRRLNGACVDYLQGRKSLPKAWTEISKTSWRFIDRVLHCTVS